MRDNENNIERNKKERDMKKQCKKLIMRKRERERRDGRIERKKETDIE